MANVVYGGSSGPTLDNGIVDADTILYYKTAAGVVRRATRGAVVGNFLEAEQDWNANQNFLDGLSAASITALSAAGVRIENDAGGLGLFVGDLGDAAVGTATPGVNIVGTFDYPSTIRMFQVDGENARLIARGSASAAVDLIDTGAGADAKWAQIATNGGVTKISSLTDAAATIVDAIEIAHATGAVTLASTITTAGLIFDHETLSVYDQGTWAPVITGSTGNPTLTYTAQVGKYSRIGNVVLFSFTIVINAYSGGTGTLRVSLPVAAANDGIADYTRNMALFEGVDIPGTPSSVLFNVTGGQAYGYFFAVNDNAAGTALTTAEFAAGDTLSASGFYFA